MDVDLKRFTHARVAQGRTGHSLPTSELLAFQLDHARARDAVHWPLTPALIGLPHILVHSAAPDRATYLRRPDLGRGLHPLSQSALHPGDYELAIVIADGLSAKAVERHAAPLLEALQPRLADWRQAPLTVALQARVAIGDHIGHALGAKLALVLIGERPGLTSPDSMGAYLTWHPRPGRTDAERNCVSNIRPEGLSYAVAAGKILFLLHAALLGQLTGVNLKEDAPLLS